MVNFWPKSKAIGLVFCQNLIQNRLGPFYFEKCGTQNWSIFGQKVRL